MPTHHKRYAESGDLKYKDVNGDKVITDADRIVIGNPTPKFMYGFSIEQFIRALTLESISRVFQEMTSLEIGEMARVMLL